MRDKLIKSTESFLQGHIDKHIANIENLLDNHVALAEHPDIIETIEKELDIVAGYEDKLNVLKKYFGGSTSRELLNERVPGE
jgi:hypothetical protein|tara:strand:+ start:39 stop:284 length:246 start_codon:yes stop_codon:yes gene_type:complete